MKSLSELCEITLMRNHSQLEEVKNIPYRLIHNILWKVKMPQLVKLEKSNVLLVFEDDEMWLNFLKQDFPTSVHDSFITKKDDIKQYYLNFINDNEPEILDTDAELIKMYFRSVLKKDLNKNKFKVPYRMLYQRYQEDVVKKQEKCTERLRLQMKQLQQEREKNQTVVVDQSFYLQNQPKRSNSRMPYKDRQHSELFRKSVKDHGSRLRHFKSGGFDIAKRHSTRVAFGGAAGDTANDTRNETRQGPLQTNSTPIQPPKSPVQKRRVDPPSIFLQRKKPSHARPSQDSIQQPSQPITQASNANRKTGHKKKSAIFSAPESKPPSQNQNPPSKSKDSQMVYIFDKKRQP
ncbi:hypothetical protein ZYGR_0U02970 [Zygosaccharomyces rouxii]|uniref:Elongin-A n=1 Tax=Zygosaccharomyces rouxii TaxID=4956 RepID=A0A1Q3A3Z1_ZYGRO|nr:hypothetical protein ZYGR_0U02970 [Zygosaccharomyces rouxii]